ncbi:MAG TPA: Hpt domain-containing protein, partial [Myxococcales bacterium]|nr:Hpt domain-containing protein [Myxococcales bacterium]
MLDPMMEELLPGFVDESKEIVDRLTEHLLELEKARDDSRFDDLARGLHTLKGSAATLGLAELSELAHRMEDAVLPLRKKPVALPGALTDALLKTLDTWLQHLRATTAKTDLPDLEPSKVLLESVRGAIEAVDPEKGASNAPPRSKRERRERPRKEDAPSAAAVPAEPAAVPAET